MPYVTTYNPPTHTTQTHTTMNIKIKEEGGYIILSKSDFELLMIYFCNQFFTNEAPPNGDSLALGEEEYKNIQYDMQNDIDDFVRHVNTQLHLEHQVLNMPEYVLKYPIQKIDAQQFGWIFKKVKIKTQHFRYIIACFYNLKEIVFHKITGADADFMLDHINNCYDQCDNVIHPTSKPNFRQSQFFAKYGYGL